MEEEKISNDKRIKELREMTLEEKNIGRERALKALERCKEREKKNKKKMATITIGKNTIISCTDKEKLKEYVKLFK
jgi:hypothetical protein